MRNRSRTVFLIIGTTLIVMVSTLSWMSSAVAEGEVATTAAILVDHTAVDAAQIPQTWLDVAREIDTFFAHRSVGNNILEGMADWQSLAPGRYTIDIALDGPDWFIANGGILHQLLGTNTEPQTKIDGFDAFIRGGYHTADVAMMKFCPSDVIPFGTMPAANIWINYRDMMAALEQDYPNILFVWWTIPLSTASDDRGNDQKEIFNESMRSYCDAHNCVLFDIADIESHDPDGNPVVSPAGYEAMWDGYSDDGGHLNETGRVRVAAAYWWLLARIAGWEPGPPPEPDFALSVTPETVDVVPGNTAVYTISIQGTNGFSQSVQLDTAGLPPGTAVTWGENPLPPDQATTLSAAVSTTTSAGAYLFHVMGTAATPTDVVTATLDVVELPPQPDFTLNLAPETVGVVPGNTAVYTTSVQGINGFSQLVQLDTAALPTETAVSWQENPLLPNQTTIMTVTVDITVPAGAYLFNVIGTAGTLTKVATATLRVLEMPPEPGFVLHVMPELVTVMWGHTAVYTVSVQGIGGFSRSVQLDTAGLPATVVWGANPLPPNQETTMAIAVDTAVSPGDYPFNVTGTADSLTEVTPATLCVRRPLFLPLVLR